MNSNLLRRFDPRFVGILAILAVALTAAVPGWADKSTKNISFDHEVMIGGTKLPAGEYTLVIDGEHLTVTAKHKIVAQASVHWEARDEKPDRDSVLYGDNNQVMEIRFAHQREVLVVAAP
jgi:hypothetical protein